MQQLSRRSNEEIVSESTNNMIRLVKTALLNVLPTQIDRIQAIKALLSVQLFNKREFRSYTGSKIHIACKKIPATANNAMATYPSKVGTFDVCGWRRKSTVAEQMYKCINFGHNQIPHSGQKLPCYSKNSNGRIGRSCLLSR